MRGGGGGGGGGDSVAVASFLTPECYNSRKVQTLTASIRLVGTFHLLAMIPTCVSVTDVRVLALFFFFSCFYLCMTRKEVLFSVLLL